MSIVEKYTLGHASAEEVNDQCKVKLNSRNFLLLDELETHGLLDCGLGEWYKVKVVNGVCDNSDFGTMDAICVFGGHTYEVGEGGKLTIK